MYLEILEKRLEKLQQKQENSKLYTKNAYARERRRPWNKTITGFREDESNRLT